MKPTRFDKRLNRGTARCRACGKRTWASYIDMSTELCPDCYDAAGLENEHLDGHHKDSPNEQCPLCQGEVIA